MWIGVDDTDSVTGGCTTYIARVVIEKLQGVCDVIGFPRLVRLNPNIPWKTRGNGAVCIQVGVGGPKKLQIGRIGETPLSTSEKIIKDLDEAMQQKVQSIVTKLVESTAHLEDDTTNPGVVFLTRPPDVRVYSQTVSQVVRLEEIVQVLDSLKASYWGLKTKRGLIGATAACAWNSQNDLTYEVITYRNRDSWGTPRMVDEHSVIAVDLQLSSTFDNYDYQHHHLRVMPNSPCPVLYGIRGENYEDLYQAVTMIKSESLESWILFQTNQATDEHLRKTAVHEIQPNQSVIVEGVVTEHPRSIQGGHVLFSLKDATGVVTVAAYEPTKEFRHIIRKLVVGDEVVAFGGVRREPLTVNLEKIQITKLRSLEEKVQNPVCPKCGKSMKSKGTNQGFICRRCHTKSNSPKMKTIDRGITVGLYEVPVCARRHLSKPIKRIKKHSDLSVGSIV